MWGDARDVGDFPGDGLGVFDLQRISGANASPHAPNACRTGPDGQKVRAHGADAVLNVFAGPASDGDHGDNRPDADDDAEHREG